MAGSGGAMSYRVLHATRIRGSAVRWRSRDRLSGRGYDPALTVQVTRYGWSRRFLSNVASIVPETAGRPPKRDSTGERLGGARQLDAAHRTRVQEQAKVRL